MADDQPQASQATYTRRRLLVAGGALAVPALVLSRLNGDTSKQSAPATSAAPPSAQTAITTTTTTIATEPVVDEVAVPLAFDHEIAKGSVGEKVVALQDRLRVLAFDPGPSDGLFGPSTQRSVWAFEKLILDTVPADVTGVVTAALWGRMNEALEVKPRRSGPGSHLEILLPSQVAVLYVDNVARVITHVSSGTGEEWCDVVTVDEDDGTQSEQGICGIAVTPGGVFHFERRVDGWRNSKLGRLWNPVYFNYGIAVHGAGNVPKWPASHGCVRIPMHIGDYFPSLVENGDLVYVFDGVEEPETYGAQVPTFDYPDPDWVSTTTTTTTTTTTQPPTTTTTTTQPPHDHPDVTDTTIVSTPPSPTSVAPTTSTAQLDAS